MKSTSHKKANRRRSMRNPSRMSTKIKATKGALGLGTNIAHSLGDVSEIGASIFIQTELPINQELAVELTCIQLPRPLKTLARVVWCEQIEEGLFKAGIEFDKPLAFRDIQRL